MNGLLYLLVALTALSVLVFFHELGHFMAARFFGVTVERFSIGFGKIIGRKKCCETEWVFSAIPLGGYVKMKGQDDTDPTSRSDDPDSYNSKRPWQRIIILLAGPLANLILAFVIYLCIALMGAPLIAAKDYITPIVGAVSKGSPAEIAGIQKGDKILSVNGKKIKYWYEISRKIQSSPDPIKIRIERQGSRIDLELNTKKTTDLNEFEEKIERRIIGIIPLVSKDTEIHFDIADALFYAWNETVKASMLITK